MLEGSIDSALPKVRRKLAIERFELSWTGDIYGQAGTLPAAIMYLCRTSRVLKHGLRSTMELWGRLHGEIDFDDVLVICVGFG